MEARQGGEQGYDRGEEEEGLPELVEDNRVKYEKEVVFLSTGQYEGFCWGDGGVLAGCCE